MEKIINRGLEGMLEFPCDVERLENGNTLITDAGDETEQGSEIIEVNPLGQIIWNYTGDLRFAHSAKRLKNGNTLISDTNNNRVLEVNTDGEIIFSTDNWNDGTGKLSDKSHLHYPNDAHIVEDNKLLITDRNNNRCLIVDRDGKIEWCYQEGLRHPHNCDLLDNGNVLIADSDDNNILEVNRAGKVVWSLSDVNQDIELTWPRDADLLESGNLLITDSKNSRVIEVNREGDIEWEYTVDYFSNFYEADRLPGGNILISDQQHHQVLEVDEYGNVIWNFRNLRNPNNIFTGIKNGSLKKKDNKNWPKNWILYSRFAEGGGSLDWEKNEKGREYPVLQNDSLGVLCLQQLIAVVPGRTYSMAGKLKAEDMAEDSFTYLQMAFLDEKGGLVEDAAEAPKGIIFEGDMNWTEDTLQARAPENSSSVELRIAICGSGKVGAKDIMFFG
ncbi:MAG: PQQ-binding-like beta-propeller repeat protein [bacterium]